MAFNKLLKITYKTTTKAYHSKYFIFFVHYFYFQIMSYFSQNNNQRPFFVNKSPTFHLKVCTFANRISLLYHTRQCRVCLFSIYQDHLSKSLQKKPFWGRFQYTGQLVWQTPICHADVQHHVIIITSISHTALWLLTFINGQIGLLYI